MKRRRRKMPKRNVVIFIAILIFGAIVFGQALAYFAVPYKYEASVVVTDHGEIEYTVSTNSAVEYTVLAYSNAEKVERLFIYYDESYAVHGVTHSHQNNFIRQTIAELAVRGFKNVSIVNAAELSDILDEFTEGDAVLVTSGLLPDTVYSAGNNKIFEWVGSGGILYWIGYAIGAMSASGNDKSTLIGYQTNIFGDDNSVLMQPARSAERSQDPLGSALTLNNNNAVYGLRTAGEDPIPNSRSLGFEHEEYSSVSLVESGHGMICVIGGSLGATERASVSQLISSGVTVSSELLWTISGSVVRDTVTGTTEVTGSAVGVHVRMGEPNTVYARTFFSQ